MAQARNANSVSHPRPHVLTLCILAGVLFAASPTKACLLASPADDLFVLPASPTLPLPALPSKPGNNTTTNIPPWAELPDGWGGGNHTAETASSGLTPAQPEEAAPTTNAETARAGHVSSAGVAPPPINPRNTFVSAQTAPVQAPGADQAAVKQDTPPSWTPPSTSAAPAHAKQAAAVAPATPSLEVPAPASLLLVTTGVAPVTSNRPGRTPLRFRTSPTPQAETQETPAYGGNTGKVIPPSATAQPAASSEPTAGAAGTSAGTSSGQGRMLPGGRHSSSKRRALVTVSSGVRQHRRPVPEPARGAVSEMPPQHRTAHGRHAEGTGTAPPQHSTDLDTDGTVGAARDDILLFMYDSRSDNSETAGPGPHRRLLPGGGRSGGKHLLSGSDVVDVSETGSSKHETAVSTAATVRPGLPGGGRSGGKHLLSDSDVVDVSETRSSKHETAVSTAATVRPGLPGGGRSGGKHLLSGTTINSTVYSTNSNDSTNSINSSVANGTNTTGAFVGGAREAAEAATGPRLLPSVERGSRRLSGVQLPGAAQAGPAPPVARTAPSRPSNVAPKVQPMAVRPGGRLGPKLPQARPDCSWWERLLAVLEALMAGGRQQKRC